MTEHIQIGDITPRIQYVGNGTQTAFAYPFPIFQVADLAVFLGAAAQTTGFTVAGAGNSAGGVITFVAPPANGVRVTLQRRLALQRISDFQADGIIRAKTLNDELDYQVAATQQVVEEIGRAVKRSATSPSTADLTLPEPSAGRALKWAADGLALVNSDTDPDAAIGAAQQAAAAAAASASDAATSEAAAAADRQDADLARQAAELARDQAQAATSTKLSRDGSDAMTAPLRLSMVATPAAPAVGEVKVYAKADGKLYRRDATSGEKSIGGGPSLGADSIIRTNSQTIAENITFPAATNGMSAGPITIAAGYTVEIPAGSNWSIV